ncbi:MAG: 5'/3'-nucleotidase SurE [Methanotrichaceae archaeon]
MYRILVTNDDGVHAAGMKAAVRSVDGLGQVIISAPSGQKSGVGRSVSVFAPLRYNEIKLDGHLAYEVSGTPTDSVILGIFWLMEGEMPDLVLSGINIGENISTDTVTTSGTIGAALEAASYGIPAIAASIQVVDQGDKFDSKNDHRYEFDVAVKIVRRIVRNVLEEGLPRDVDILNVNVPVNATEDTEIVITRLARKIFKTAVHERTDPRGRPYYWIGGELVQTEREGTDVWAVYQEGKISITPLTIDNTARVDLGAISKLVGE